MENPFKFGTIVEEEYFTDRVDECHRDRRVTSRWLMCDGEVRWMMPDGRRKM